MRDLDGLHARAYPERRRRRIRPEGPATVICSTVDSAAASRIGSLRPGGEASKGHADHLSSKAD
jgi:hypothetical protein